MGPGPPVVSHGYIAGEDTTLGREYDVPPKHKGVYAYSLPDDGLEFVRATGGASVWVETGVLAKSSHVCATDGSYVGVFTSQDTANERAVTTPLKMRACTIGSGRVCVRQNNEAVVASPSVDLHAVDSHVKRTRYV